MTNLTADHPHTDPGDGRQECLTCGKWVWPVIHSCKRVPVTAAARARAGLPSAFTQQDALTAQLEELLHRLGVHNPISAAREVTALFAAERR